MKNITVSVPDDVYGRARVKAAERGTSVSRLVADYLESLSNGTTDFDRLLAKQKRIQAQIKGFSAGDRLSREELYDDALRRH